MQRQRPAHSGLPPYVSYSAWSRLLESLKADMPDRIDNSLLRQLRFNQATRSTVASALRFFQLVSQEGEPTSELRHLMASEGEEYQRSLKAIVERGYASLLAEIRLTKATQDMVKDAFRVMGAHGEIARKCASFFVAIAHEAGLRMSVRIRPRRRRPWNPASGPRTTSRASSARGQRATPARPSAQASLGLGTGLKASVLDKIPSYPQFDPSWDPGTKQAWFESYAEVLRVVLEEESGDQSALLDEVARPLHGPPAGDDLNTSENREGDPAEAPGD